MIHGSFLLFPDQPSQVPKLTIHHHHATQSPAIIMLPTCSLSHHWYIAYFLLVFSSALLARICSGLLSKFFNVSFGSDDFSVWAFWSLGWACWPFWASVWVSGSGDWRPWFGADMLVRSWVLVRVRFCWGEWGWGRVGGVVLFVCWRSLGMLVCFSLIRVRVRTYFVCRLDWNRLRKWVCCCCGLFGGLRIEWAFLLIELRRCPTSHPTKMWGNRHHGYVIWTRIFTW